MDESSKLSHLQSVRIGAALNYLAHQAQAKNLIALGASIRSSAQVARRQTITDIEQETAPGE